MVPVVSWLVEAKVNALYYAAYNPEAHTKAKIKAISKARGELEKLEENPNRDSFMAAVVALESAGCGIPKRDRNTQCVEARQQVESVVFEIRDNLITQLTDLTLSQIRSALPDSSPMNIFINPDDVAGRVEAEVTGNYLETVISDAEKI